MTRNVPPQTLLSALDDALDLLHDYGAEASSLTSSEPLPSLLKQCELACAAIEGPQPLRTIHHFACTGGTLMSKTLFALPNTVLLSEIDPLSTLMLTREGPVPFAPTDLIFALRHSVRPIRDETIIATFLEGLGAAKAGIERDGRRLVLRDHAHSQFCVDNVNSDDRPTLREMVASRFDVLSVVTMRHPLDSFLSLRSNNWVFFTPGTLEEYSRRYLAFLARFEGVPVVLYEDFTADPASVLRSMCEHLGLTYSAFATDLIEVVRLSGDSGRSDARIGQRARRKIPAEIDSQRIESVSYRALCTRFGYEP